MEELKIEIKKLAEEELERANEKFPLFHSDHEALGVLEEEVMEVDYEWKNINNCFIDFKLNVFHDMEIDKIINIENLKIHAINACAEMIQVIAMCDKFIDSRVERDE